MDKTNVKYSAYVQILTEELVPAMGCTEPIAIAYAAAKSREVLGGLPDHVLVEASGNLIKNVKSVVVPNTGGLRGIAAGIVAGKADLLLEVISQVTKDEQSAIEAYMERDVIQVEFLDSEQVFDLRVTMKRNTDEVKARIVNYHTNLVHLEHNGRVLLDLPVAGDEENNLADRTLLNMKDILDFANTVDIADVKELLDRQIEYNMAISQEGLSGSYGANIGQVIRATSRPDDLIAKAKSAAAAAAATTSRVYTVLRRTLRYLLRYFSRFSSVSSFSTAGTWVRSFAFRFLTAPALSQRPPRPPPPQGPPGSCPPRAGGRSCAGCSPGTAPPPPGRPRTRR